ncbi:MAG: hypothetical protein QN158_02075 [Armatimonadota bacterium]|nr:hypothetical protein [Armatimonadota bacterium]
MRLGEILVSAGLVTPEQITAALAIQRETGERIGEVLLRQGWISEDDLAWALSNHLGFPYVFLTPEIIDPDAVRLLPEEVLRTHRVVPILRFERELTLGMVDPTDEEAVETVRRLTGLEVKRALVRPANLSAVLGRLFHRRDGESAGGEGVSAARQFLRFHLVQALQQDATEMYVDPAADSRVALAYRIRGVAVGRPAILRELYEDILTDLRGETGLADSGQGSFTTRLGQSTLTVEVTLTPTRWGTAAALVLHPLREAPPALEALGVAPLDPPPVGRGLVLVACPDPRARRAVLHALAAARAPARLVCVEAVATVDYPRTPHIVLGPGMQARSRYARAVAEGRALGPDLLLVDDLPTRGARRAALEAAGGTLVLAGDASPTAAAALERCARARSRSAVLALVQGVLLVRPVRLLCPVCGGRGERAGGRGCDACLFTGFSEERLLSAYAPVAAGPAGAASADAAGAGATGGRVADVAAGAAAALRRQAERLLAAGLVSPDEVRLALAGLALPWPQAAEAR